MQHTIDLSGLKDIHLPEMPSPWPPADNVYILLLCCVGFGILMWVIIRNHGLSAKKYALDELNRITTDYKGNSYEQMSEVLKLIRRSALLKYPREEIAALHGQDWVDFLNKTSKGQKIDPAAAKIIQESVYMPPEQLNDVDVTPLINVARQWINAHL